MKQVITHPAVFIALTLGVFMLARLLQRKLRFMLLNPVLVSIVVIIALLKAAGIDYETYNQGGKVISFFLGPAVVALGYALHLEMKAIRKQAGAIIVSITLASLVGIAGACGLALLFGSSDLAAVSLAPKSATAPIAMGIALKTGGEPSLTAALVIITGIFGAVFGPWFLRLSGVSSPGAVGIAMGTAAHGIGTARALELGSLQGSASGLAMGLNGLATAVLTPMVLQAVHWLRELLG